MSIENHQKALVIIPVHNEEKKIAKVLDGLPRKILNVKIDILVIDDGSTDKSKKIAKSRKCNILSHPSRLGYGTSVRDGFSYGLKHKYDYILKLDADGQHDPFYIGTIVKILLRGGVDYVISSRYMREVDKLDIPPIERRLVNTMCTGAINSITKLGLSDVFCGIFGLTYDLLSKLDLESSSYGLELEMILQSHYLNARFLEIPHPLIYTKESSKFLKTFGNNDRGSLGDRLALYSGIILDTLYKYKIKEI
ncbi:hypothetical protein A2955_05375 [Candidatus Woesebacteria bacterium RIFCSPLOWO2_01_FULL_37_19]|uniref:Glycosyltransferase 2-like domain-containing protein n=2 Tax=Candidatus Woeseibacteriota TaxID=1752722 RepID=A0A1F8B764_9BACT|nr:MAG: hypothetical protein A2771_04520 [Candidatus Woesebacteria bacterium RIFCSPHIGHO2_01_FULL_38_26b]OGM59255.1 MAG: hypothetical protein A2955_05375 [Candidatus Woesebacteria bacterium RIFCSPLOWO2_01_FULL_37_19]